MKQDKHFYKTVYWMDDNACKDWSVLVEKRSGDHGDEHGGASAGAMPPARVEYAHAVFEPNGFYSVPESREEHGGNDDTVRLLPTAKNVISK